MKMMAANMAAATSRVTTKATAGMGLAKAGAGRWARWPVVPPDEEGHGTRPKAMRPRMIPEPQA